MGYTVQTDGSIEADSLAEALELRRAILQRNGASKGGANRWTKLSPERRRALSLGAAKSSRAYFAQNPGKGSITEKRGKFCLMVCIEGKPRWAGTWPTRAAAETAQQQVLEARRAGAPLPGFVRPHRSEQSAAESLIDPVLDDPEDEPRFAPMYPSWPTDAPTVGNVEPVVGLAVHDQRAPSAPPAPPPAAWTAPLERGPSPLSPALSPTGARLGRPCRNCGERGHYAKTCARPPAPRPPVEPAPVAVAPAASPPIMVLDDKVLRGRRISAALRASWARKRAERAAGIAKEDAEWSSRPAPDEDLSAYEAAVSGRELPAPVEIPPPLVTGPRKCSNCREAGHARKNCAHPPVPATASVKGSPEYRQRLANSMRASWLRRRAEKAAAAPAICTEKAKSVQVAARRPAPSPMGALRNVLAVRLPWQPERRPAPAQLPPRCPRCIKVGHVEADCPKPAPGFGGTTVGIVGPSFDSRKQEDFGDEGAGAEPGFGPTAAPAPDELDDDEGTDLTDLVDVPDAEPTVFVGLDASDEQCGFCAKIGHRSTKCPDAGTAPAPALIETVGPTLVTPPRPPGPPHPALGRGRIRGKTIAGRLSRVERADAVEYPDGVARPLTRADCQDGPRPCPFVSCAHHLYLDVNADTGSIKINFPLLEVDEMRETCSLDVADRGGATLEEVGALIGLTRERIRQVETRGLEHMKENAGDTLGLAPERVTSSIQDHAPFNDHE